MCFRIYGFEFRLKPSFIVLTLAMAALGYGELWAMLFVLMSLHELAHIFTASAWGGVCERITIYPFGQCAVINGLDDMSIFRRFAVLFSGPFFNLLLGLVFLNSDFGKASLAIAVFNMLPIYPLDGGRLLQTAAGFIFGSLRSAMWLARLSYVSSCLMVAVGIVQLVLFEYNCTLLLLGLFLLKVNKREYVNSSFSCYKAMVHKNMKRAMPVRFMAMSEYSVIKTVLYRMGNDYYTVVAVVGREGIVAVLDENDIRNHILNKGIYARLIDAVNEKMTKGVDIK